MTATDICFWPATEIARCIRTKELTAREVMEAHYDQIERYNPTVNAIVSLLDRDEALGLADDADHQLNSGGTIGPLHGLPIAHKDLHETRGMRTTFGSPLYRDYVPDFDCLVVERLRAAGGITIGKTNVPEFGAGSHTFNPVFGTTRNPFDVTKSAGGSSGGAGAALASGMLPIADGGDSGGSLRNPGNFNNVVGFRPSPGRVPSWPSKDAWAGLTVKGPMARTVGDVALMLSVMAGPDHRAPISISSAPPDYRGRLERDFRGVRIAWSSDLGGLPVEPQVTAAIESQLTAFESVGCIIEEATPNFDGADEAYEILRSASFALSGRERLRNHRELLKETVIWNIEDGLKRTAEEVAWAHETRTLTYHRVRQFLSGYEFFLCPVNQVAPFDAKLEYPRSIGEIEMDNYVAWMRSASRITLTGLPAISVPCSFTPQGLPVGIQIVGRWQSDLSVLQLAHAFEQCTQRWKRRPSMCESIDR